MKKLNISEKNKLLAKNIPIIIGGCGRSGTTLLLSILSAHPGIFAIPFETRIFTPRDNNNNLSQNKDIEAMFLYQYLMHEDVLTSQLRWCEKTPKNIYFFEKINSFFENKVKMIHIVRDGRDVVTSVHPHYKNEYWVSPERWVNDVNEGLKYKTYQNVLTLKYEDLILNYHQTIKEILIFLNLDFHENMINWITHSTIISSPSIENKMIPIHSNSIGKWNLDIHKKRISEFYNNVEAKDLLKKLGYEEI